MKTGNLTTETLRAERLTEKNSISLCEPYDLVVNLYEEIRNS